MRCKACDVRLNEYDDPEMCDACLETIKSDFEILEPIDPPEEEGDNEDAEM